jgi:hypothetical protein
MPAQMKRSVQNSMNTVDAILVIIQKERKKERKKERSTGFRKNEYCHRN